MEEKQDDSRRPADTPFQQQRLPAWSPILTPFWVTVIFLCVGIPFVVIGKSVKDASDAVVELRAQYDGGGADKAFSDCQIDESNVDKLCTVDFTIPQDMKAPVFVYYQLSNFYQNHRRYVKSRSYTQLLGEKDYDTSLCEPLIKEGNGTELNPCGLIANTLFNDKIILSSGETVKYSGISWKSDSDKFKQPHGFKKILVTDSSLTSCWSSGNNTNPWVGCSDSQCSSAFGSTSYSGCKAYKCTESAYYNCNDGDYYYFYYPDDDSIRYLYENYPEVVSPIDGITNERFIVWMRTAALPKFRKLYARITDDLKKGDTVSFNVTANFDVSGFKGTKSIVLSTTSWFGGKNAFLGIAFIVVGTICLALSVLFGIKQTANPRQLGDLTYLQM